MIPPAFRQSTGHGPTDDFLRRIAAARGESVEAVGGGETIQNNGVGVVRPGRLYGRDDNGRVIAATRTNGPMWLALTFAGVGGRFRYLTAGECEIAVDDKGATYAIGAEGYLSDTVAGAVDATVQGTGTVWRVGRFRATTVRRDSTIPFDLAIDSEPIGSAGGV